ncbi:MAG: glycerophosphodiester phosphodiesterase family protein [Catalinimonas sp.]
MRHFLLCLLLLPFAAGAQHYHTPTTPAELRALFRYAPDKPPLISAHRGGPTVGSPTVGGPTTPGYPENCLATFEHTLASTWAVMECDPQLTKDSVIVLMHDATLDRTTDGTGPVSDYTLAELRKLRLKDNAGNLTEHRVPTLAEALTWARGRAPLMVDLKRGLDPALIEREIRRHGAEAYASVITYTFEQARRYHTLNPELLISVSIGSLESLEKFEAFGVPFTHVVAFTGVGSAKPAVLDALHVRGVRGIVGTMGNLDREGPPAYRKLLKADVDMLSTDRPAAVAEVMGALNPSDGR